MSTAFDEMNGTGGVLTPAYRELARWLKETPAAELDYRRREAELLFRRIGITFAVYGETDAQERLIPFDVIPRILSAAEWQRVCAGLEQRVKALNMFIKDVYGAREVLHAGILPEDIIFRNVAFRPEMNGEQVPPSDLPLQRASRGEDVVDHEHRPVLREDGDAVLARGGDAQRQVAAIGMAR